MRKTIKYWSVLLPLLLYYIKYRFVQYNKKLFEWHCKNIYPFHQKLTSTEILYIQKCIQYSYWELLQPFYKIFNPIIKRLNYFAYSHRSTNKMINSSRIAYGSVINSDNVYPYALEVLREKNIKEDLFPSHNIKFYRLGWDLARGHFKIYFLFNHFKYLHPTYKKLLPNMNGKYNNGLISITYDKNQNIYERKLYSYFKNKKFIEIKSEKNEEIQRECSGSEIWKKRLNGDGKTILDIYEKGNYKLNTIVFEDKNNYKMYFPKM